MKRFLSIAGCTAALAACQDNATSISGIEAGGNASLAAGPQGPANYIVVFRPSVRDVGTTIDAIARDHGASVRHRYGAAIHGFAGSLPTAAVEALRRNPNVEFVEEDGISSVSDEQLSPPSWGLDRIDQRTLPLDVKYAYENAGAAVEVYILDTGIRYTHTQFGGRAVSMWDYVDGDNNAEECHGHGTHVAGTVGGSTVGVAKSVTLYGVRVLGCSGSGSNSGIIAAIDSVTKRKLADPSKGIVGNMSLGGGFSSALNTAVNNSVNAGVVWAVAAGNSNANACNYSPAAAANALTVGATTITDSRASYSNFGSCVDLFAPGSGIYSSTKTSDTSYEQWNGTSMATPHVAGAAALVLASNPGATAAMVNSAIKAGATAGVVTSAGTGSPNLLLYTLITGAVEPPPPPTPVHLAAASGSRSGNGKNNWSATLTVQVHSDLHQARSGAVVSVSWSGASSGSGSCTTGSAGTCSITRSGLKGSQLTFSVTGIGGAGVVYSAAANHASTTVTVLR